MEEIQFEKKIIYVCALAISTTTKKGKLLTFWLLICFALAAIWRPRVLAAFDTKRKVSRKN